MLKERECPAGSFSVYSTDTSRGEQAQLHSTAFSPTIEGRLKIEQIVGMIKPFTGVTWLTPLGHEDCYFLFEHRDGATPEEVVKGVNTFWHLINEELSPLSERQMKELFSRYWSKGRLKI